MVEAIANMVIDGALETWKGYFATSEWLKEVQNKDDPPAFRGINFSSAPYWLIYFVTDDAPVPYKDEEEVFAECFD
jgi:hypothetical protein